MGQGFQIIYDLGGLQGRASAVVVPVAASDAAAGSVFVGRDDAVTALLGFLDPAAEGSPAVVVSSVSGLAGVGKTALAGHVASLAVGRGWYPGGAVFTDLRGYDPANRVSPGQLYGPLLRALGVPADEVPPVPDEQAAAYHRHLASLSQRDRPVLLVLDNVSGPDQVADLLPRHRAHRALVTSRHTLGELDGVRILDLDVLTEADAGELLDQVLRSRDPADRRITEQPRQARELARLCGGLPLALRITAALLADDVEMPLADMVAELADTSTRLSGLSYGERAVASAFDLSFRHMGERDARAARMFWLLSVNPGPEVATEAAAVLADRPIGQVRQDLRMLRQAHLVERGTDTGRWRMHDLVGLFAARLAETEAELPTARDRLLRHYLTTADAADDHLGALAGEPTPDRFPGRESALAWLDTERPNLVAAVDLAVDSGHEAVAVDLALALARFLDRRRHLDDHLATAATAV
ncbi:MAG TPA: AAA family ATPase, partial [Mycobacteriales bacterium]